MKLSIEPQYWNFNNTGTSYYEKQINIGAGGDKSVVVDVDISRDKFRDNFTPTPLKIQAQVYILDNETKSVFIINEKGETRKGLLISTFALDML